MSFRQVRELEQRLRRRGLRWNDMFAGGPVVVSAEGELPVWELHGGLRVTVLSPESEALFRVERLWEKQAEKLRYAAQGLEKGALEQGATIDDADEDDEDGSPDERPASAQRQEIEEHAYDFEWLASQRFQGDRSAQNGASIAVLLEHGGASVLVGGDARADALERSIRRLLEERGGTRLRLHAFVVPHGGSDRNLSVELLQLLDCERYVFSTSGKRFNHPGRLTVARIVIHGRTPSGSGPQLIFNYRTESTERWDDPELKERYGYTTVYPDEGDPGIELQFGDVG